MAKIIHFMIRVLDAERSKAFYADAFDLHEVHHLDFADFSLHYLRNAQSGTELELTVNKGQTEPYAHGGAYGHMAVVVDDLDAARPKVAAAGGGEPGEIVEFMHEGELLARFFFVTDPDGYEIEVLQRHGHFQ